MRIQKKKALVGVFDLPMKFWSNNLFQKIGGYCRIFLEIDYSSIYSVDGVRIKMRKKDVCPEFVLVNDRNLIWKFFTIIEKTSEVMKPEESLEKMNRPAQFLTAAFNDAQEMVTQALLKITRRREVEAKAFHGSRKYKRGCWR